MRNRNVILAVACTILFSHAAHAKEIKQPIEFFWQDPSDASTSISIAGFTTIFSPTAKIYASIAQCFDQKKDTEEFRWITNDAKVSDLGNSLGWNGVKTLIERNCHSIYDSRATPRGFSINPILLYLSIASEAYRNNYKDKPMSVNINPDIRKNIFEDFSDCIVLKHPEDADSYFRAEPGSVSEHGFLEKLMQSAPQCAVRHQKEAINSWYLRIAIGTSLYNRTVNSVGNS